MHREQMPDESSAFTSQPESTLPGEPPEVDLLLADLARTCNRVEPDPRGLQRLLARATEEGLVAASADVGQRSAGQEAKAPLWRPPYLLWRGAWAVAASMVLGLVLWQLQPVLPEAPPTGMASVEIPEEAWVRTQRYARALTVAQEDLPPASAPESVTPAPMEPANATSAAIASSHQAGIAEQEERGFMPPGDNAPAPKPPSLQWPTEVLAAAQLYAASREGLPPGVDSQRPTAEVPLRSVRVQMAADDLWRMGLSTTPGPSDRRVTADFLVQENGRPLAVRLVSMDH